MAKLQLPIKFQAPMTNLTTGLILGFGAGMLRWTGRSYGEF